MAIFTDFDQIKVRRMMERLSEMRALIISKWLHAKLSGRTFAIISNNCWGAHIYRNAGLQYSTPFVGLFLMPDCYLKLLKRFRALIYCDLEFLRSSKYELINDYRQQGALNYPIGVLGGDLEVHFLHCSSEADARDKWKRRVARLPMNDDDLFVKFCDRDGCTTRHLEQFESLPFKHKVCFTAALHPEVHSAVRIPESRGHTVPDGLQLSQISYRYFNALAWITRGDGRGAVAKYFSVI